MLDKLGDRLTLHLNSPVQRVSRHEDGVTLQLENGSHTFDQVIFACHSGSALAMLDDPTRRARGAGRYRLAAQRGGVAQRSALAAGAAARLGELELPPERAGAGQRLRPYNMNILQGLPAGSPLFCVTLNPDARWMSASFCNASFMNIRCLTRKAGGRRRGAARSTVTSGAGSAGLLVQRFS
jgi:predicted NAD/FAD-binding protein